MKAWSVTYEEHDSIVFAENRARAKMVVRNAAIECGYTEARNFKGIRAVRIPEYDNATCGGSPVNRYTAYNKKYLSKEDANHE